MLFACIHVPEFSLEAILRAEPGLREQPLALLEGAAPLLTVAAANEQARHSGIEVGMSRLQAEAGSVELRRRSALLEAAAHAALLDCAHGFSPRVEDHSPGTVMLDIDGLEQLFGPPQKIARDMAHRARHLGLEANVSVAANLDAALHAARGFPGVTVITPGEEAARLAPLPVDVLFTATCLPTSAKEKEKAQEAQRIMETLDRWGVRSLRSLAALPPVAMTERLGQKGLLLQRQARGATSRVLAPSEPALVFEESLELEYPVTLLEPLGFLLARLLDQLCARLAARALATHELRLQLHLDPRLKDSDADSDPEAPRQTVGLRSDPTVHQRTLNLPVPMQDARIFLKLLQLDLKSHPPTAPVLRIQLAAEPVRPRVAQHGLFMPASPEPEKLELTMARMSSVVGEGRLGSPRLLNAHRPDTFRMARFSPPPPSALLSSATKTKAHALAASLSASSSLAEQAHLALRMFRPPLPARVESRDQAPVRLFFNLGSPSDAPADVVALAGPWRSSGEWWNADLATRLAPAAATSIALSKPNDAIKPATHTSDAATPSTPWARDEWDVAVSHRSGQVVLYRIFRDLHTGNWFVEGSYD